MNALILTTVLLGQANYEAVGPFSQSPSAGFDRFDAATAERNRVTTEAQKIANTVSHAEAFWYKKAGYAAGMGAEIELKEQRRKYYEAKRHERQRKDLILLSNGLPRTRVLVYLRKSLMEAPPTDEWIALQRSYVGPLGPENFQPVGEQFSELDPQGMVNEPPLALAATNAGFFALWKATTDKLRRGEVVVADDVVRLRTALRDWETNAGGDTCRLGRLEGVRAQQYLRLMRGLVENVAERGHRRRLRGYLQHEGFQFAGGNLGSLLRYLIANNIVPAPGSEAQLHLATAVNYLRTNVVPAGEVATYAEKVQRERANRQRASRPAARAAWTASPTSHTSR